jgi:hypothetical protein
MPMMKLRVFWLTCLFLIMVCAQAWAVDDDSDDDADDDDDDDDDDDEDEEEEDEEDRWGEAKLDHELNIGWDYSSNYNERPLVYSRFVTEFTLGLSQKESRHYWDEDGNLVKGPFRIKKQTIDFALGVGLSDKWSIRVNFPFVNKKTKITDPGNPNYRYGRDNTYGYLGEEALVDFFDNHELWRVWEADLPSLGDIVLWSGYSLYQNLDPRTTSVVAEVIYKTPSGNDNPRRGSTIRNYLTDGTPDFYVGLAAKQQLWRFSGELHGGYNFRMKGGTKYSAGSMDFADQIRGDAEVAFQIMQGDDSVTDFKAFGPTTLIVATHYMQRVNDSTLKDNQGNTETMNDTPGFEMSVEPKLLSQGLWPLSVIYSGELFISADIPVAGQRSFLEQSRSMYRPPYELESYESVGISYTLGLVKRWQ